MSELRPVFLFGPPGVGKSTLGARACASLGLQFAEAATHGELPGGDVVAVPWSRVGERAVWTAVRKRGYVLGLWAHPVELLVRSTPAYRCTPARTMTTHDGFGRSGDATREYRLLDRHCHATLSLHDLDVDAAVALLVQVVAHERECVSPLQVAAERTGRWVDNCVETYGCNQEAAQVAATAMGLWLEHLDNAGKSPRQLSAIGSDLQAALLLVCGYEQITPSTVLRCFSYAPHSYEFRCKFTDSVPGVQRYERNLDAFGEWLRASGRLPRA